MEFSRDSKWVLFVCLQVICGDCLLCKGYNCQHHAALMYEDCHWEQHKWAAHRCPQPLLLSQHHILMISLRFRGTLSCKSFSLWTNSDGFCGLDCHLQREGAEGCVVSTWSCHTTASVLQGWVQHTCADDELWVCWEMCCFLIHLSMSKRGRCGRSAESSPCCAQGSWPYLESSVADNRDIKLQWFGGSEVRSLCSRCTNLLEVKFSTCSTLLHHSLPNSLMKISLVSSLRMTFYLGSLWLIGS